MSAILHIDDTPVTLEDVRRQPQEAQFTLNGRRYHFHGACLDDGSFLLEEEVAPGVWRRLAGDAWRSGKNSRTLRVGDVEARIAEALPGAASDTGAAALSPPAPMPGRVTQLLVAKGQTVGRGQALAVLEAMKLQLTLSAGDEAVVEELLVAVGQLVEEGTELVRLTPVKP